MASHGQKGSASWTPHHWLILLAMTGAQSMTMLDKSVVAVTLPTLGTDLSLSPVGMQWVVNAYVLALASFVAVGGRLAEVIGGVATFRLGVLVFVLASTGCAFAPPGPWGEAWIIGFRALQGIGAALMLPVSIAIVLGTFSAVSVGLAVGFYTSIAQVFQALGPLVGGVLTEFITWRAVFWINVPVGLLALLFVMLGKPESARIPGARMVLWPTVLLVLGCGGIVCALQQGSVWGWTSPLTLGAAVLGLVCGTLFVRGALRSAQPLIDVRLLANRVITADFALAFMIQFGTLAAILFGAMYLQDVLKMGPLAAGLAILPLIITQAVGGQFGGRWYDRAGIRNPALAGFAIATVGLAAWAAAMPFLVYWPQVPGMALTGLGLGLALSPTSTDGLARAGDAERNEASGMFQTFRQLGGSFGVATVGAIILSINPAGSRHVDPARSAEALSIGFAATAIAVAAALVLAFWLLPRRQARN